MIQELFGASASKLLNQDQTIPTSSPLDPSPSPSSSTTTTTTTPPTTTTSNHQNLRCPRCDSSHTKFCYYNNYNLTQPRHFCKTCRRYWTKGGALRNVPIGGGCRKNKQTTIPTGKPISTTGKLKTMVSCELGKPSNFMHGFELDHQSSHNPNIIWSHPPQTSHLLSLFRATQNPNPNPNFASNTITHMKDHNFMGGSHMGSLGFESLCSSLWRNNQQDHQNQHQDQDQGMISSGAHEGIQNQRLRSSTGNYYNHHDDETAVPLILGSNVASMTSSSTSSSTILDSAPVIAGSELGFWNQTLPWSDLAASNGAYP